MLPVHAIMDTIVHTNVISSRHAVTLSSDVCCLCTGAGIVIVLGKSLQTAHMHGGVTILAWDPVQGSASVSVA